MTHKRYDKPTDAKETAFTGHRTTTMETQNANAIPPNPKFTQEEINDVLKRYSQLDGQHLDAFLATVSALAKHHEPQEILQAFLTFSFLSLKKIGMPKDAWDTMINDLNTLWKITSDSDNA